MYGRPEGSGGAPPWLVRAEVTIRHGGPGPNSPRPNDTSQESGTPMMESNGVRMYYRWSPDRFSSSTAPAGNPNPVTTTPVGSFGFRRGNILFTSTPPARPPPRATTIPRAGFSTSEDSCSRGYGISVSDSGYNSEQFSPQSYSSLPSRRPSQQYNRRCKSTCSIVLSTMGADNTPKASNVGRDQSLYMRPDAQSIRPPWKDHSMHQHVSAHCQFSTVPEGCEDCTQRATSNASAFTTHFCTRVPEKRDREVNKITGSKDAASQTTDVESEKSPPSTSKFGASQRASFQSGSTITHSQEQNPKNREEISSLSTVDSRASSTTSQAKSDSSEKDDSAKRKSRTVHIDVYCTGSDDELDDSDSEPSSDDDQEAPPKTVFQTDDVKVTHSPAKRNTLPRGFQDDKAFLRRAAERRCESFRQAPMRMPSLASSKGYESDDVLSSLYPSQYSSYSALRDIDSVPWSAASSSVAMPLDICDSASGTSWKDTISDVESAINSRNSLTPCDSFEYANSADRDRIEILEETLAKSRSEEKGKSWRSPHVERKHLLRSKKMREYLEKHQVGWSSGDSLADSEDSVDIGWTFEKNEEGTEDTKANVVAADDKGKDERNGSTSSNLADPDVTSENSQRSQLNFSGPRSGTPYMCSLRDQIGPFGSNSPSPLPSRIESRVTSPFTTPQGERTDHIVKASIFGTVVGAFRKPGHHIGPSKNPSCSCEHCRRYFEEITPRGRSSSLGALERTLTSRFQRSRDIVSPAPSSSNN
ncbi:uncharacterized protein LOC105702227 [Orussus abietinus]|uniref:uncharacterized protein LOC105702227 n=1 Tax=Orussus abietinus TaxID=222816 RepID=UPI000625716D|nr:uncharacterized protein LOC105702227 [Orussus abietinus]